MDEANCAYRGRPYDRYLELYYGHPSFHLSITAIRAKLATLQYASLAAFEDEINLLLGCARELHTEDLAAQEFVQKVKDTLDICKAVYQWENYDGQHQGAVNNNTWRY